METKHRMYNSVSHGNFKLMMLMQYAMHTYSPKDIEFSYLQSFHAVYEVQVLDSNLGR